MAQTEGSAVRLRYGLWAVLGGFGAIMACFVVAVIRYGSAADSATAAAPAIAAIGTLAGAYFGIQVGSARNAESDKERSAEHATALRYASLVEPLLAMRLIPSPDPSGGNNAETASENTNTQSSASHGEAQAPDDQARAEHEAAVEALTRKLMAETASPSDPNTDANPAASGSVEAQSSSGSSVIGAVDPQRGSKSSTETPQSQAQPYPPDDAWG